MEADDVYAILINKIKDIQAPGGGVTDYADLDGKPQINGVTLQGNLTSEDLGIPALENMNEASGTPVGEIISYMGTVTPPNYLICDGAVYPIADYPYLAQHFVDNFGSANYFGGNGTSTFAVPDLRGEFLRGTGTNGHASQGSGANVGSHQDSTEISEIINYKGQTIGIKVGDPGWNSLAKADRVFTTATRYYKDIGIQTASSAACYGTIRPTNTSVLYCIKYK